MAGGDPWSTGATITWCPGCGNYGVLTALKRALSELGLRREEVVIVTGIGCHGRMCEYINVNSIHVIHGRVLPVATGIKIANPRLTVIGHAGDGDAYAIGLGHLPHAARRNIDITYIVHNNMIFGLTTGQAAPTTPRGFKTRSTPFGNPEDPLNPILLALASGATFVARGFAGDVKHLAYLIREGIKHRGFAFIDVLQPCATFYNTYAYYRERVYKLEEEGHDPADYRAALEKALEWGDRIPIGVFYRAERPTILDELSYALSPPPAERRPGPIDLSRAYALLR